MLPQNDEECTKDNKTNKLSVYSDSEEEELYILKSDEESEESSDFNTEKVQMEESTYDFEVDIKRIEQNNLVVAEGKFSTKQHNFWIGLYLYSNETKEVYPFIYMTDDIEKPFHVKCTVRTIEENPKKSVIQQKFYPDIKMLRSCQKIYDSLPEGDIKLHVRLKYIPSYDECRKYFNCVGLVNDGMTCYLNSLVQVLYHIKGFRKIVFDIETDKSDIPNSLAYVFARLQTSNHPVRSRRLTKSFGWGDSDLHLQQDAQELMCLLFDRIDNVSDNSASRLFCGKMKKYIKIEGMENKSEKIEDFHCLILNINQIRTMKESLELYFKPDTLDDKYTLEDGTKVDAMMVHEVVETPPILCFNLRRFEFKHNSMQKIITKFEYDEYMNFFGTDYKLISIISHKGTVYGGHYNAFVSNGKRWLAFDDESIFEISAKKAIRKNYGGPVGALTAYILFYCRVDKIKELIECDDPEINPRIIEEFNYRKNYKEINIVTENTIDSECIYKKVSIPKNATYLEVIDVLKQELQMEQLYLRPFNDLTSIGDLIVEKSVLDSKDTLYICRTEYFPVILYFWIPEHRPLFVSVIEQENLVCKNLLNIIREKFEISGDIELEIFAKQSDIVIELSEDTPIEEPLSIYVQIKPNSTSKDVFQSLASRFNFLSINLSDKSLVKIIGMEINNIEDYNRYSQNMKDVELYDVYSYKLINLSVPKEAVVLDLKKCISKLLDVDISRVSLFEYANSTFNPIPCKQERMTLSNFFKIEIGYYSVAPDHLKGEPFEIYRVTVLQRRGLFHKNTIVYLPRGDNTVESLLNGVKGVIKSQKFLFYLKDLNVPVFMESDTKINTGSTYMVQLDICKDEDEALIPIMTDSKDVNPYFYPAKYDDFMEPIFKELECHQQKRFEVYSKSERAKYPSSDFFKLTTKEFLDKGLVIIRGSPRFLMESDSTPMKMSS